MNYVLSNLSFDFGQRRASGVIQVSEDGKFSYLNVNLPIDPPSDVSAKELEDYILREIRQAVSDASKFTYQKPDDGTR